ncbi:uncharacterized protein LOC132717464 [Ruditapes philippinarum]|uniref:uncharacterized protein LOC132717464 n=1 Tax=Ruditapes philippinarum TaxID=129788 RepID=UPI00295B1AD6|nr:uncharacterized protein LOC132717464 [Ruditapes philippinarum]
MNGKDQWKTLPLNNKFNQFEKNMIYYLILTDSVRNNDEGFYRVHYYNETIHCWMDAGKLTLEAINNSCGLVYLRSEKVIVNGTVEIEYYPSTDVMQNSGSFERRWIHSVRGRNKVLTLVGGSYEETFEQNNKYVLTIFMFNISMDGDYGVYCGSSAKYTDFITVKLPEPPSVPKIVGLQDIENCTDCIVGEDNEMFKLTCEIHGGSRPLIVTMTIGNESYQPQELNSTTFMVFFTVRDHHHMESVIFSVMNDALSSPLSATAQMFVIKPPTFQVSVPEILRDGEAVNITCTLDDGRPNPNVYFSISGSEVSSANSHYYNSTTSLNTNIITLTTFKKEWNKENITCCRYNEWYTIVRDCSPPIQINYHFPPTDVMLEVKSDEDSLMYATCTVYGSNPVCNVQIKATSGIIGSEKSSENISLPHGAWNSVYEVNLNVREEDNGTDVTCKVECDEFLVDLTDTVKILLPSNRDGIRTGDNMSTTGTNETGVGLGAVIGSVIAALAVGILIGVTCTMYILTRKGIIAGSKTQPTVSREIELTGPPTALDTYEQLQNRTDTEIRGTYDSLEVNSRVEQNSQSQYESLNQDVEKYHTYTDLKQSR